MTRWWKFNAVGLLGAGVQLLVLAILTQMGVQYLAATAMGVETAVLHNYAWHVRWTWADRGESHRARRLWRFHLANGLISLLSNLILMRWLVGWMGLPLLVANALAIVLTAALNFMLGDRWVFQRSARTVASSVASSESRGRLATNGRMAQPRPVGISRDKEMVRHSR